MDKPYVLGLDLGGTNSVFGIVDTRGEIKATTAIKTKGYADVSEYVDAACLALEPVIESVGGIDTIRGMGIGAPNANYYTGTIDNAANLEWKGSVPLAKMFSDKLGIPVAMTNDANAAAVGEMTYGVARGMKNFIMITLGTGVGSGIVVNGQLVYGSDGYAGELGHVIVDYSADARVCGCGRKGCLETYCSGTGIARTAREMLVQDSRPSILREYNIDEITGLEVTKAAQKGDQVATDILAFTGATLGKACANFALFCSPEAFVFFGGPTKAGDFIMEPLRKAYDDNILYVYKGKAKLLLSKLNGSDAAVLGASALAWELPTNDSTSSPV